MLLLLFGGRGVGGQHKVKESSFIFVICVCVCFEDLKFKYTLFSMATGVSFAICEFVKHLKVLQGFALHLINILWPSHTHTHTHGGKAVTSKSFLLCTFSFLPYNLIIIPVL